MKYLHLTRHQGTVRNINSVFNLLNMENPDTIVHRWPYFFDFQNANSVWEKNEHNFKKYDFIIITDTAQCARPLLQNIDKHNIRVIIYLPMPFDWDTNGSLIRDHKYTQIYAEASNSSRVVFLADTRYLQYHAEQRGIKFLFDDIVHPSPVITDLNIPTRSEVFISNRAFSLNYYKSYLAGLRCVEYNKKHRFVDHSELSTFIGMVHLPYNSNTMMLWENLGYNIVHFIPSKRMLLEFINKESWYYWQEKIRLEKHTTEKYKHEMLNKSIDLSNWYHSENKELFEYFDSWDELRDRVTNFSILARKQKIIDLMFDYRQRSIKQWKEILEV